MIIQENKANIEKYLKVRESRDRAIELKGIVQESHPNLNLHMWLIKTMEGYIATDHDAVYMGRLLKMHTMKYHQTNIGRTVQLLIIPEEQLKNACSIIRTYCEPVVICDPAKDPVSITVASPEFAAAQ